MSTDNIDKLYKNYEILSEATDKSKVRTFLVFVVIFLKLAAKRHTDMFC